MTPAELTALVAAALPDEHLSLEDIENCCFGPDTRLLTAGDIGEVPRAAAVVFTQTHARYAIEWILLLVVHPEVQRQGLARELVARIEAVGRAAGVIDIHLGNAAPRYVWPGIPLDLTPAVACFQSLGFTPYDHGLNMNLSTGYRAAAPAGVLVERETGDGAIELARRAYPQWVEEVTRGMTRDGTFAARDTATGETIGFACHSVNRHGWIGPMATDPERRSRGVGNALLSALSEDIAAQHGLACGEISWASPVPFYAKAGATINRTFRMARRQLGEFPG